MSRRNRLLTALLAVLLLTALTPGCLGGDEQEPEEDRGPLPRARVGTSGTFVDRGDEVEFDGTASTGTGLEYHWDFGDDTAGKGPTASHLFTRAGSFTITLTVSDKWGREDRDSVVVKVNYRELVSGKLDVGSYQHNERIPVGENSAGFKLTLTYPSGTSVGGIPSNDLDMLIYYPNGTEARSSSFQEPDGGDTQEETLEVPQQELAAAFWEDWDLVVTLVTGLSVDFELEIFVMY